MNVKDALKLAIDSGNMVAMGYLEDLTDREMFHRPCQGANHINWQVGHLIASEHEMGNQAIPGSMPPLPAGFAESTQERWRPATTRQNSVPKLSC